MRTQRIMRHQLLGNLLGKRGIKAPRDINSRQFPMLAGIVVLDLLALKSQIGLFCVRL